MAVSMPRGVDVAAVATLVGADGDEGDAALLMATLGRADDDRSMLMAGVDKAGGDDDVDDVVDEDLGATRTGGTRSGMRRMPWTLMWKFMFPTESSDPSARQSKTGRSFGECGVNSREPKQIGSARSAASGNGGSVTAEVVP